MANIAFSDIKAVVISMMGSSIEKEASATGITTSYVCCDTEYDCSAYDSHGGIYWETRSDAVYIRTADSTKLDPNNLSTTYHVTLHFGIPENS